MRIFKVLDKRKVEEIRKFVKEHWKNDMNADQVIEEVEKRFGYRLSRRELKYLYEDMVRVSVDIPLEVARQITRRYGSLSKGIKAVARDLKVIKFSDRQFQEVYEDLAGKEVTWEQLQERLGNRTHEFLRELHRKYLLERRGNKFYIRVKPEFDLLTLFQ